MQVTVPEDLPFDENATPNQNPDLDIESISETPSSDEFFLYSRIDGQQTVGQLCSTSGLGRDATLEALRRLVGFGVVEIPGVDPSDVAETSDSGEASEADDGAGEEPSGGESADSTTSEPTRASTSSEPETSADEDSLTELDLEYLPVPPSEFDFDREAMELDVPLDAPLRREILCLHAQVDDLDHYQFFGLPEDASEGDIKKAYFKLSKRFHPDKHFGKDIGVFEDKIEEVFQKITRAHRTLSNPEKRAAYDEELDDRRGASADATEVERPSSVDVAGEEESETSGADASSTGEEEKHTQAFERLVEVAGEHGKRGELEEAAQKYRKALALRRDAKVARRAAKLLYERDHDLEEATLFARAALKIEDGEGRPETRVMLGAIFEARGDEAKAKSQYETALEIDPDYGEAEERYRSLAE